MFLFFLPGNNFNIYFIFQTLTYQPPVGASLVARDSALAILVPDWNHRYLLVCCKNHFSKLFSYNHACYARIKNRNPPVGASLVASDSALAILVPDLKSGLYSYL
jgi:hypothetical protein